MASKSQEYFNTCYKLIGMSFCECIIAALTLAIGWYWISVIIFIIAAMSLITGSISGTIGFIVGLRDFIHTLKN